VIVTISQSSYFVAKNVTSSKYIYIFYNTMCAIYFSYTFPRVYRRYTCKLVYVNFQLNIVRVFRARPRSRVSPFRYVQYDFIAIIRYRCDNPFVSPSVMKIRIANCSSIDNRTNLNWTVETGTPGTRGINDTNGRVVANTYVCGCSWYRTRVGVRLNSARVHRVTKRTRLVERTRGERERGRTAA